MLVREEVRRTAGALAGRGVPVPAVFTMAARPGPGEAGLGVPTDARAPDVTAAAVGGLLPRAPDCARRGEPYPAAAATGTATAWLTATANSGVTGTPGVTADGRSTPADSARAAQLLQLPEAVQLAWYRATLDALADCGTLPPPVPHTGAALGGER